MQETHYTVKCDFYVFVLYRTHLNFLPIVAISNLCITINFIIIGVLAYALQSDVLFSQILLFESYSICICYMTFYATLYVYVKGTAAFVMQ